MSTSDSSKYSVNITKAKSLSKSSI
jgi:hypothetical protein